MYLLTVNTGLNLSFPDVCNTPAPSGAIPLPYPNISDPSQASSSSAVANVVVDGAKALNLLSEVSSSMGDELGSAGGGVVSGQVSGPTRFMLGSFTIFMKGAPAARMTSLTGHNGKMPNAVGMSMLPTQQNVLVLG